MLTIIQLQACLVKPSIFYMQLEILSRKYLIYLFYRLSKLGLRVDHGVRDRTVIIHSISNEYVTNAAINSREYFFT